MYDFDVDAADAANPNGCGVDGHPITCLCDVYLDRSPEPTGRIGPINCTVDDFANWAAYECEKVETLAAILRRGVTADRLLEAAEQVKIALGTVGVGGFDYTNLASDELQFMLGGGLSVRAVGRLTALDPEQVVHHALKGTSLDSCEQLVQLDDLARSETFTEYTALTGPTGLSATAVRRWCHMIGVERQVDHTPKERAVELYRDGLTARQVAETVNDEFGTDWNSNSVHQLLHRMRKQGVAA